MSTFDAIASVRAFLLANVDVAAITGGRIFGAELPPAEAAEMPRKSIVLSYAGARLPRHVASAAYRIDVKAYGETFAETDAVRRAAGGALLRLQRVSAAGHIESAVHIGGPVQFRDPETNWPRMVETFEVRTQLDA